MPNSIKYTVGATSAGCLRKGNMLIGNGTADYGSTFWTGITPPSGGYTIYQNKAANGPSIYCPASDAQLITMTNTQVAGTVAAPASYTTAAQCLDYYCGQTDKICTNLTYEGTVTSGSIFHVDAGYTVSYPTSGSSWYDLSGNTRNATLVNTPTFNSANSGSLLFDGTSHYATLSVPSLSTSYSLCFWLKVLASPATEKQLFMSTDDVASISLISSKIGSWNGGTYRQSSNTITLSTWFNFVMTCDGTSTVFYVNGATDSTFANTATLNSGTGYVCSSRPAPISRYLNANLSNIIFYDRALSLAEVSQNFNAQKARYGL